MLHKLCLLTGMRIIKCLNKRVGVDEVAGKLLPGVEYFGLLHLLESLAAVDCLLHHGGSLFQHLYESAHVIQIRKCAVPGNYLHVRWKQRDRLFHRIDHALDAAAAGYVNKRKTVAHKVVTHVHDFILRKENDRVAVCMTGRKMECSDVLAVKMHGHVILKGDDWQGSFDCRLVFHLQGPAIACSATAFQTLADIVLGDHR